MVRKTFNCLKLREGKDSRKTLGVSNTLVAPQAVVGGLQSLRAFRRAKPGRPVLIAV